MFNDKYSLTEAVLEGNKTMTRREFSLNLHYAIDWKAFHEGDYKKAVLGGDGYFHDIRDCGYYRVGEIVAIAQSYRDTYPNADFEMVGGKFMTEHAGWANKMFVCPDLMPHHIRINAIKAERLRDISDEDCIKEGIVEEDTPIDTGYSFYGTQGNWETPREAFAALIDKVSGKGTWYRNPWVFAYEFERID